VEVQRLFSLWKVKSSTCQFQQIACQSEKDLEDQRESWVQAGEEAIQLWLARRIKPVMQSYKRDPSHLSDRVQLAILCAQSNGMPPWRPMAARPFQTPASEDAQPASAKTRMGMDEHLSHSVLRRGLPFSFVERTKKTINGERRFESLGENFLNAVTLHIVEPALPAFGFQNIPIALLSDTPGRASYRCWRGKSLAQRSERIWCFKRYPTSHFHHQHPFQR